MSLRMSAIAYRWAQSGGQVAGEFIINREMGNLTPTDLPDMKRYSRHLPVRQKFASITRCCLELRDINKSQYLNPPSPTL